MAEQYRFQGHPGYLSRVAADDSTEVVGLAQQQTAIADTANLLSQCADADPTHRKGILDAAKLRARAARIAADVCDAMVQDIEANVEMPDEAPRILLTPGPEAGFRQTAPTKPAVVSEVDTPGPPGEPPDRHTLGPDTHDRKNPDDGTSQPVSAKPEHEGDKPPVERTPAIVDHRDGQEERHVTPEPNHPKNRRGAR